MTKQWLDRSGIVHLLDTDILPEVTWCNVGPTTRFAGKTYHAITVDRPPTCIVCIANEAHFWALSNIRKIRT